MTRARSKKWNDSKRVSFTLSFAKDPEILAFLYSDEAEASRIFKNLLRDHVIRTGHPCSDPVYYASVRQKALLRTALGDDEAGTATPPKADAPRAQGAATEPAPASHSSATPPTARVNRPERPPGEKNKNTIKTFLS